MRITTLCSTKGLSEVRSVYVHVLVYLLLLHITQLGGLTSAPCSCIAESDRDVCTLNVNKSMHVYVLSQLAACSNRYKYSFIILYTCHHN